MNPSPAAALYNFDHGFDKPRTFRFGPYEFEVTPDHVAALEGLPRHAQVHQQWDAEGRPVVEKSPVQSGQPGETALVRRVDPLPGTPPYLGGAQDPDGIGELCTLLSFLTGRRVLRAEDRTAFDGMHYGERVVGGNFFWTAGVFWPDLAAVQHESLAPALWAVVQIPMTNDLIAQQCHASAALDRVVTLWHTKQRKAADPAREAKIDEAVLDAETAIRAKLGDSPLIADVLPRIRGLFQPSAVAKLIGYLQSMQLISDPPTAEETKRVKLLNMVRNRVLHTADIPSELHRDETRRAEIASVVRAVIADLAALRLADVMGLQDWLVDYSREQVRRFFSQGEYNGFRVFQEDYGRYIDRLSQDWVTTTFGFDSSGES